MIDLNQLTEKELDMMLKLIDDDIKSRYKRLDITSAHSTGLADFSRKQIDLLTILKVKILNLKK
jgi:hypothetical protein